MNFIAQYWWLWLLGLIVFGALTIANQIRRMKGMMSTITHNASFEATADGFFSGIGLMVICGFLAWASGLVLLISVIINLIQYAAK